MKATASEFDLETTYLTLDGAGGVRQLPVGPDFWATIAGNPAVAGTLVTVFAGRDGDWEEWEMHPGGDEVLVVLEGALGMIFEYPDGRSERHDLAAGATLVIPRGAWHRAVGQKDARLLFITYGAGTRHKPIA